MVSEELSGQEQQVNLIIKKIQEIIGDKSDPIVIADMIKQVIQMREKAESDETIKKFISSKAGFDKNDEKASAILDEIAEKPFQNNYHPFKNSLLEQLKKDMEKE